MRTLRALVALASLALVVAVATVWLSNRAAAQIDLTGTWNLELVGVVNQTLQANVTQNGTALTIDFGVGDAQLSGTIDPATGEFNVFGCPGDCGGLSMTGTTSPDGRSMSGTFLSDFIGSGTFTGTRKAPPPVSVGGYAELPEGARSPLETGPSAGPSLGVLALTAAAVTAGAVALGGVAWYARRSLVVRR